MAGAGTGQAVFWAWRENKLSSGHQRRRARRRDPRAEPGWWRGVRGVAEQSEARKRVGLHTPHSVRGVSLCYTLSSKAAFRSCAGCLGRRRMGGLEEAASTQFALAITLSGTFFPFFSRLTATSRRFCFTKFDRLRLPESEKG